MLQLDRLTEVVREHGGQPADRVLDATLSAVGEFAHGQPQTDEITVMVLHRRGDAT